MFILQDDDDDEDSDSTMFERQCMLLEKEGNVENALGQVDLRILYDDDVFGARIAAYSGNQKIDVEMVSRYSNNCKNANTGFKTYQNISDILGNETTGIEVCNHLIAMQTTLDVSTPSEGNILMYLLYLYSN